MYELIRTGDQPRRPAAPSSSSGAGASPRFEPASLVSPGMRGDSTDAAAPPARFVRVPVGLLYLAVAVVLVAVVGGYLYGVSVGERMQRERLGQQRADEMDAAGNLPKVDPLAAGKRPASLGGDGEAAGAGNRTASGDAGNAAETPTPGDLGPAPGGDPRENGLNYFIVAHTATRNGEAMVTFCRKNGLDAHLVPDDNGELRLVIILPGFAGGERQSAEVKALERRIREVGRRWKDAARGNRDFGDAYPSKFVKKN
ncbi:MAG: hypothetical protein JNM94_14670 [Phycisphaerae bacterium]|nr:hypothetical protein [Phycisphaerae bacterium]